MDRGAWRDTVPGVTESQTPLRTHAHAEDVNEKDLRSHIFLIEILGNSFQI